MNVLDLVQPEERADGRTGFVISGDELYGTILENIREVQKGDVKLNGDEPGGVQDYRTLIAKLPAEAWDLAEIPYDDAVKLPVEKRELRFQALEEIRKFVTEKLHQHIGGNPMVFHITKDEENRWRL